MNAIKSMGRVVSILYSRAGQISREEVELACEYLNKGGVVALPTDTIYGLAAKVTNSEAIKRIFQIKGRDSSKPLSVCIATLNDMDGIADTTRLNHILTSFFPGPVTLLLKRDSRLNPDLNPGIETIGVRIPDNNFIRAVCQEVGPLALTSANKSGDNDPIVVDDFQELHPELDCIFDSGTLRTPYRFGGDPKEGGLGSTVIDLSSPGKYKIIREGCSLRRYIGLLSRFGYRREKSG